MPKPVHHPPALTLAPDCMNANAKKNLLDMMETSEGRAAVVLLIVTLLEVYEQDQPAPSPATSCSCEICTEASSEQAQLRAAVQAENP